MRGNLIRFVYFPYWRETRRLLISPLGCYTLLFALAVYLNPEGPYRWPRVKRPVFILSVFMYLFCSTHFALQYNHFYTALVCVMPYSSIRQSLNTSPEYQRGQGIRKPDKHRHCCRYWHDTRGFYGSTYFYLPLLGAVVQELLGCRCSDSRRDFGRR